MTPKDELAYLGHIPFSATFYSEGKAKRVEMASLVQRPDGYSLYLAVPKEDWVELRGSFPRKYSR